MTKFPLFNRSRSWEVCVSHPCQTLPTKENQLWVIVWPHTFQNLPSWRLWISSRMNVLRWSVGIGSSCLGMTKSTNHLHFFGKVDLIFLNYLKKHFCSLATLFVHYFCQKECQSLHWAFTGHKSGWDFCSKWVFLLLVLLAFCQRIHWGNLG